MKLLPEKFTKSGWRFEQISRSGMTAVFKKTKGRAVSFETIRIQSHKGFEIAGNHIAPSETYPSSESWGTYGFTFTDENRAKLKALELCGK